MFFKKKTKLRKVKIKNVDITIKPRSYLVKIKLVDGTDITYGTDDLKEIMKDLERKHYHVE